MLFFNRERHPNDWLEDGKLRYGSPNEIAGHPNDWLEDGKLRYGSRRIRRKTNCCRSDGAFRPRRCQTKRVAPLAR